MVDMTERELIEKAREHMRTLGWRNTLGAHSSAYNQARVVDTKLIYSGSQARDDYVEVVINSQTGEAISIIYHPQNTAAG